MYYACIYFYKYFKMHNLNKLLNHHTTSVLQNIFKADQSNKLHFFMKWIIIYWVLSRSPVWGVVANISRWTTNIMSFFATTGESIFEGLSKLLWHNTVENWIDCSTHIVSYSWNICEDCINHDCCWSLVSNIDGHQPLAMKWCPAQEESNDNSNCKTNM